jgi:hypothetical protein
VSNTFRAQPPEFNRETDEFYLSLVRSAPCCVCGNRAEASDPHHLITRGAGGSDLCAIPLCRRCHAKLHKLGLKVFSDAIRERDGIELWAEAAAGLARYVRLLKEGT